MPNIKPISDLRNYASVLESVEENQYNYTQKAINYRNSQYLIQQNPSMLSS